jgi:hypothetical protein
MGKDEVMTEAKQSLCAKYNGGLVKDISLKELREFKGLEVIASMLCGLLISVDKVHDCTNNGTLTMFDYVEFLAELDKIKKYVEMEYPPTD